MKKVSIIIPMYNVEKYLKKCVDSVFDQGFDQNSYEIIMIDDESPDNSREVAENMAVKNPCIKVISQKNKGLGGARNTGIQNAEGDYIIFLDADDWLLPNKIDHLIQIANSNKLDVLEFGANLVSEDGKLMYAVTNTSDSQIYNGIDYYNAIKYAGSACNKLYSRSFLISNNLEFLEKIYGEDFEFNTRTFFKANRVMAINDICVEFLQSQNSITRNTSRATKDKYLSDYIKILKSIISFKNESVSHSSSVNEIEVFFEERLTMVNINAFYMMFKNNYSYQEIKAYRNKLMQMNLFYTKGKVAIKKKDLFRKFMLNNFFLFSISQPLKKMFT